MPQSHDEAQDEPREEAPKSSDALSPSVRRLVRQYDLDVTRIRGTGPEGRIRVADVVALIGARGNAPGTADDDPAKAPARVAEQDYAGTQDVDRGAQDVDRAAQDVGRRTDVDHGLDVDHGPDAGTDAAAAALPGDPAVVRESSDSHPPSPTANGTFNAASPVTTVFECDLGRVLANRKRQAQHGVEPTITSYYLVACGAALESVPEVGAAAEAPGEIGLWLATSDGDAKALLVDIAAEPPGTPTGARVQGVDLRIRAAATAAVTAAGANDDGDPFEGAATSMLVHQHGASGSLLATATPLGPGHAASLGVGRVRKQVVVRNVDGDDGPRVAALAYLTLSFDPRRISLQRANRFMAALVRFLEHWPDD